MFYTLVRISTKCVASKVKAQIEYKMQYSVGRQKQSF